MIAHALLAVALQMQYPTPGFYAVGKAGVYVGVEAEPAESRTVQYFDPNTRRVGTLRWMSGNTYETADAPLLTYSLTQPSISVEEQRFRITDAAGLLGASFWHAPSFEKRPTVVLVHGADDETRDMGFIIPYFVAHGLNVVTYDQRGTGQSVGDWKYTSPQSKANDIIAILTSLQSNARSNAQQVGLWAFSNGAWAAPIVATRYPLGFLILKSPAAEPIAENVLYEIKRSLREASRFSDAQIDAAIAFDQLMFASLATNTNWESARAALSGAKAQPWFSYTRIPATLPIPPPPPVLARLQAALIYDPTPALKKVRTPTLALFGALDKNVDTSDSEMRLRRDFSAAGNHSLTIRVFPDADHTLSATATGFEDQPLLPGRVVLGYPEVIIEWLRARGIVAHEPHFLVL